jgi:hypothetical protein
MKKFEIRKNTAEYSFRKRKNIHTGCTTEQQDQYPEVVEDFDGLEEAKEALKKYNSDIRKTSGNVGTLYEVTEYYIEENVYDEDGEWISGGDIWEFANELNTEEIE